MFHLWLILNKVGKTMLKRQLGSMLPVKLIKVSVDGQPATILTPGSMGFENVGTV
jgi:hypothetical protein